MFSQNSKIIGFCGEWVIFFISGVNFGEVRKNGSVALNFFVLKMSIRYYKSIKLIIQKVISRLRKQLCFCFSGA